MESAIIEAVIGELAGAVVGRLGEMAVEQDLAGLNLVQQVGKVPQSLTSYGRLKEWKKSGLLEIDAKPVAIDAKVEQIPHLLEDDAHQVIALVGMAGLGKTFLLINVYNHHKVQQRFKEKSNGIPGGVD